MVLDTDIDAIKDGIKRDTVIIYGLRLVRKELRAASRSKYIGNRGLRISLLSLYDEISKMEYEITEDMKRTAEAYYKTYREFGGSKSMKSIIDDLLIVACASAHQIDIVVSEDNKSMLTENALKAYRLVNSIMRKRTPDFIGYEKFKQMLRGG